MAQKNVFLLTQRSYQTTKRNKFSGIEEMPKIGKQLNANKRKRNWEKKRNSHNKWSALFEEQSAEENRKYSSFINDSHVVESVTFRVIFSRLISDCVLCGCLRFLRTQRTEILSRRRQCVTKTHHSHFSSMRSLRSLLLIHRTLVVTFDNTERG